MKLRKFILIIVILMISMSAFAERNSLAQIVAKIKAGTLSFSVALGTGDITHEEAIETGILQKNIMENGEIAYMHTISGPYFSEFSYYTEIPDFKANTITGKEITQDYFKQNKLTMVEIWGTYCSPCISKMEALDNLNSKYKDHGFAVLGIVMDGDKFPDKAKKIVEEKGVEYENVLKNKKLRASLLKGLRGVPYTFFVDAEGNILRCFGVSDFEKVIEVLLGIRSMERESNVMMLDDLISRIKAGKLSLDEALELELISYDDAVKAGLLNRKVKPGGVIEYTPVTEEDSSERLYSIQKMPDFNAKTLSGKELTQEYFRNNKLTMVNVWGTFCSPCIAEMGLLDSLNSKYRDRGFAVLGIITDGNEERDTAKYIVERKEVKFENVPANKALNNSILKDVTGVPFTFFVDGNGNIIGRQILGTASEAEFGEVIEELLNVIG